MGYPKYEEKEPVKNSRTHSLFVVINGTPETLFAVQKLIFEESTVTDFEIKKFEIKPIANS